MEFVLRMDGEGGKVSWADKRIMSADVGIQNSQAGVTHTVLCFVSMHELLLICLLAPQYSTDLLDSRHSCKFIKSLGGVLVPATKM